MLETRAMLAATPLGEILEISNASQQVIAADIAQTATGTTLIAYAGHNQANRLAGNDREILIQSITADGSVGDLITVNSTSRGDQSDPVIATDDNGNFMVVWSGRGAGDRSGIFGQRYASNGTAIGEQFRINTNRGGEQTQPAIAMAADGRAIVVWHGPGANDASGIWMQRIAADGSLVGDETLVNSTTDGTQAYPAVGMDELGNFVVAWSSRHQDGDDWESSPNALTRQATFRARKPWSIQLPMVANINQQSRWRGWERTLSLGVALARTGTAGASLPNALTKMARPKAVNFRSTTIPSATSAMWTQRWQMAAS